MQEVPGSETPPVVLTKPDTIEAFMRDWVMEQAPRFDNRPLRFDRVELVPRPPWAHLYDQLRANSPQEVLLFHGTPVENLPTLLRDGFDLNRPGGMGGLIGRGFYVSDLIQQSIYYQLKNSYDPVESQHGTFRFQLVVFRVRLGTCVNMDNIDAPTANIARLPGANSHYKRHRGEGEDYYRQCGHEYCLFDREQALPFGVLHLTCDAGPVHVPVPAYHAPSVPNPCKLVF